MSLDKLLRYSKVLGSRAREARTTMEIKERWDTLFGNAPSLRSVQGDMEYLATESDRRAPLVRRVDGSVTVGGKASREYRYYLVRSNLASRFITEEAATELLLVRQAYGRVLDPISSTSEIDLRETAERALAGSAMGARLRDGIRILPNGGVGRLPAAFNRADGDAAMEALGQGRSLEFDYKVDHRNPEGRIEKRCISPLGMVAKDGQVYIVGVEGLSDAPKSYALHRMSNAVRRHEPAVARPEFNLDRHIAETHQFSHPLKVIEPPVRLELRVHKAALYHFKERKLTAEQTETPLDSAMDFYLVAADVPITTQLVPFLVSMGPWVEVLGPPALREAVGGWVTEMAALYAADAPFPEVKASAAKRGR